MPRVEITISDDGSVRPDFFGFAGTACLQADQDLHARLKHFGLVLSAVEITFKPEIHMPQEAQQVLQQQHRQALSQTQKG